MEISILLNRGYSHREIANSLKKHHSSISREINENSVNGQYDPAKAHLKAIKKRKKSKYQGMKIRENPELESFVINRMRSYWSPEEIAGRIKNVDAQIKYASAPSIYKYLYSAHGQYLHLYLYSGRWRKRKRYKIKGPKKTKIPNRVSIEQRPEIVAKRTRFGDFEGDTLGKIRRDIEVIVGSVERISRYLLIDKVTGLKYAVDGLKKCLSPYQNAIETLTLDNGPENARYEELGIPTYFCHPYSSWEKATMENSFCRLRRFIPKGSSMDDCSDADIRRFAELINNTPRKCLNYRTPKEVFEEQLLLKKLSIKINQTNISKVSQLTI
ncbi:IS30 family transposase [Patescibacteria group bacterium]|nr:IS30 family transposase [Patescibacteria group bacterium]